MTPLTHHRCFQAALIQLVLLLILLEALGQKERLVEGLVEELEQQRLAQLPLLQVVGRYLSCPANGSSLRSTACRYFPLCFFREGLFSG